MKDTVTNQITKNLQYWDSEEKVENEEGTGTFFKETQKTYEEV